LYVFLQNIQIHTYQLMHDIFYRYQLKVSCS
jgi:hypothetical protein